MRQLDQATIHAVESSSATPKRKSGSLKTSSTSRESSPVERLHRKRHLAGSRRNDRRGASGDTGERGSARRTSRSQCCRCLCRPTPLTAGVRERPLERAQVHAGRRCDYRHSAERERWGRDSGCRYRCGHSTRRAAVRVRSLSSGRLVDDARSRRAGSRSRHRSAHGRAPRRNGGSGQPGGASACSSFKASCRPSVRSVAR